MKTQKTLSLLALLLGLCPLIAQAAAPVNDNFANALLITGKGTTLRNQTGAGSTLEALDPFISGTKLTRSVWYRFDLFANSTINRVIVNHSAATRVGVYLQTNVDGGQGALRSLGEFTSAAAVGTDSTTFLSTLYSETNRFFICVETAGTFDLTLKLPGAANDFFADAATMPGDQGILSATNAGCSNDGDMPAINPDSLLGASVWYVWVPTFTGNAVVSTNFSYRSGSELHDTYLEVYTGTALNALTLVVTDDDGGLASNSRCVFPVTAGTVYHVRVGTYGNDPGAPFSLEWCNATSVGGFQIVAQQPTVTEGQGTISVQVRRRFAGTAAPSVSIATANGTAISGSDYGSIPVTALSFLAPANSDAAYLSTVSVAIMADAVPETDETFTANLSAPTLGSSIGTGTATITIAKEPAIPCPGFAVGAITVKESDGYIHLPITRGSGEGTASFSFYTTPAFGSAKPDLDYAADLLSTFTMPPGVTSMDSYIYITTDSLAEGNESFTIFIAPTVSGTPIDGASSITVTIVDDDARYIVPGRLSTILPNNSTASCVDATVTAAGTVSGKVILGSGTLPFVGKLDASGLMIKRFGPATAPTSTLTIQQLSAADATYMVSYGSNITGQKASNTVTATNFNALNPCPGKGLYTVSDAGANYVYNTIASAIRVSHFAAASLKVDATGNATLTGKLFDGTTLVATGASQADGVIVNVGATLYGNRGHYINKITLPTTVGFNGKTLYRYLRPGRANMAAALTELPPFIYTSTGTVYIYTPPAPGIRILSIWSGGTGNADFTYGGFAILTTQSLAISPANAVTLLGAVVPSLKLTFQPATGLFTGSVIPPLTSTAVPVCGVLNQISPTPSGAGFFLNPTSLNYIGNVVLRGP